MRFVRYRILSIVVCRESWCCRELGSTVKEPAEQSTRKPTFLSFLAVESCSIQLNVTNFQCVNEQGLTAAVEECEEAVGHLAGRGNGGRVTPLALPAHLGGHRSHLAAQVSANQAHLQKQRALHAFSKAEIGRLGEAFV